MRDQASGGRQTGESGITNDGVIVLQLPTFTATAEMTGISRVLGGYHIQADNIAGLDLGFKVAMYVFPKTKSLL